MTIRKAKKGLTIMGDTGRSNIEKLRERGHLCDGSLTLASSCPGCKKHESEYRGKRIRNTGFALVTIAQLRNPNKPAPYTPRLWTKKSAYDLHHAWIAYVGDAPSGKTALAKCMERLSDLPA